LQLRMTGSAVRERKRIISTVEQFKKNRGGGRGERGGLIMSTSWTLNSREISDPARRPRHSH